MSNVPPILLEKLAELRLRERLLRLAWGLARVAAVLLLALMLACAIDWFADLWDDTPFELRVWLLLGQLGLAGLLALLLIALPLLRRLRDETLALFVEEKRPELQHRLISALQLNRPGAPVRGMSRELLTVMTEEAVRQVAPLPLASLADHRRLWRGALFLAPVVLLAGGLLVLFPDTMLALLQRQLLLDADIPRSIELESFTPYAVRPSGEEMVLHFKARGPGLDDSRTGTVRIMPDGESSFTVPLTFAGQNDDDSATYTAKLRPATTDFHYSARLGDGRTRKLSRVHYVPRPSIEQQDGYLILPEYVGLRPDGQPYEQYQPTGDIRGLPGLGARVVARTQKPVYRAVLRTFGSPYPNLAGPEGLTKTHQEQTGLMSALTALGQLANPLGAAGAAIAGQTVVPLRVLPRRFRRGTQQLEWTLQLNPAETSYSIAVFDEYGFESKTATVRTLKIEPEPPPTIELLPHSFEPEARFNKSKSKGAIPDFEGLPLPLLPSGEAGPMRIIYEAAGPYGIGKVQLKIGVFRGQHSSGERVRRGTLELWGTLELEPYPPNRSRIFDRGKGAFEDSPDKEQIDFYLLPVSDQEKWTKWPGTLAGGRFDYKVAGFIDVRTGKPFKFQPKDHIVVYLEVFNRNSDPAKAVMGRSLKTIERDLMEWDSYLKVCNDTLQEASRIEALMYMQQQVYDRPWLSIFGFK